ncbi:LTA synthase family protein, partial [Candidatus Saccharibacteria bacterium]|nr:LTA synthase family protein [Candidatus Saccharibacteria bacterium]
FDYKTALETGRIPDDYYVWWGYEDKKLFSYAKEELTRIAQQDQPFNFQLLTVDTHFVNGYLDPSCSTNLEGQYENVFACSSKQVADFVAWMKTQDFYENTTVIIVGDHLGMQTEFYDQLTSDQYQRTIYNVILNSTNEPINEKNRDFSSFDLYPTTLSSIGVEIDGDKLGLGVNLFSDKKTIIEEYGFNYVNDELSKRSEYYNSNILTDR